MGTVICLLTFTLLLPLQLIQLPPLSLENLEMSGNLTAVRVTNISDFKLGIVLEKIL